MPPVAFKELLDATVDDEKVRTKVEELIELKREGKECDMLAVEIDGGGKPIKRRCYRYKTFTFVMSYSMSALYEEKGIFT